MEIEHQEVIDQHWKILKKKLPDLKISSSNKKKTPEVILMRKRKQEAQKMKPMKM